MPRNTVTILSKETKDDRPTKNKEKEVEKEKGWTKVKRKLRSSKKTTYKPHPRPDAIVIARTGDMSYSDILRAVKKEDALQKLGGNVSRIRKTAKGEVLLELKETQMKSMGEFKSGICKVLGDQAQVRTLTHEVMVEIRDLDEITTKEDITEAIRTQIKDLNLFGEHSIRSIRAAYAGTQTALVSLPALEARLLIDARKIKIGWVVCRIREKPNPKKCFRCFEYGHLARACSNPEDRSQCCLKCGEKGHFAKACKENPTCGACKNKGRENSDPQIGSRKCPLYQEACKKSKK